MTHVHPFKPGDRVVCVDAKAPQTSNRAPALVEGRRYTVARTGWRPHGHGGLVSPGVAAEEAPFANPNEGWLASRFRLADDWEAEQ